MFDGIAPITSFISPVILPVVFFFPRRDKSMKLGNQAKGYICLSIVDATWIASGYVAQIVFTVFDFHNSIAMAVYSVIFGLVLLSPLLWRKIDMAELPSIFQMGSLGLIWLLGQFLYLLSLRYASMSTATAVSGTATAFAYIFSILLLKYDFRWVSGVGVLACIGGITLTALFRAEAADSEQASTPETVQGILFAAVGAVNSGIFSCLFKMWVRDDKNSGIVFGSFGFVGIVFGIPAIAISHFTGFQEFEVPTWQTALLILADAFICSVICNYFFSKTFVYLSPVIVQVGLTMTIPISFVITAAILRTHSYPAMAIVGVVMIFLAVVVVSYDQAKYEESRNRNELDTKQEDVLPDIISEQL